jgi:hypothetical protein
VPTEAAVRNYFPHVATNIVPGDDNSLNLGSPTKRWAHVYVGPGSVTIGSLNITDNNGAFTVSSTGATPPTLSVPEINTGSVRYFQNNIVGSNSNEDIIIDTSGTGKLQVLADLNMTGTLSGPATFYIDPAAVGDNTGTVVIKGSLQVDGTTTTINSTTLTVDDKNVVLGDGAANDAAADGAGITVYSLAGGNKTWNWVDATDAWTSSEHVNLLTGKAYYINGTSVLNSTTLGSGVTGSSLTSVGTLTGGLNIATGQTYKVNSAEVLSSSKLTLNGSSSGTVAFQAAATAGSTTYTLPSADASVSGYALVSNGSGTLSWAAAGATLASDTSTTTLYLGMSTATSGSWTSAKVNSNLVFNGSTSTLTVPKIIVGDNTTSSGALVVGNANSYAGGLVLGKPSTYSGYISATDNLYMRAYASGGSGSGSVTIENASGVAQFTMNTSNGYFGALGRIGVGTLTPATLFNVQDTGSYLQQFQMYQSNAPVTSFGQSMSMDAYTGNGSGGASQYMAGVSFGAYSAATGANTGIISFHTAISGTKATRLTIDNSGNGVFAGTVTSNSDATLKTNVSTITSALDKVVALRGVMFDRISTGAREMGVIAQEVEQVVPELVFTDENGIKSVAYANTVALLIEAIKEQQQQINELKGRL